MANLHEGFAARIAEFKDGFNFDFSAENDGSGLAVLPTIVERRSGRTQAKSDRAGTGVIAAVYLLASGRNIVDRPCSATGVLFNRPLSD